jgi:hypothetical protein
VTDDRSPERRRALWTIAFDENLVWAGGRLYSSVAQAIALVWDLEGRLVAVWAAGEWREAPHAAALTPGLIGYRDHVLRVLPAARWAVTSYGPGPEVSQAAEAVHARFPDLARVG